MKWKLVFVFFNLFTYSFAQQKYNLTVPREYGTIEKIRVLSEKKEIIVTTRKNANKKYISVWTFSGKKKFAIPLPKSLKREFFLDLLSLEDSLFYLWGNKHLLLFNTSSRKTKVFAYPDELILLGKKIGVIDTFGIVLMGLPLDKVKKKSELFSDYTYSYSLLKRYPPLLLFSIQNKEFALSERFGKWFSEEVASDKGKDFYGYFFIDTQMKPQALFFKFAIENSMYKYNWTGNKFVLDKKIYMPAFLHLIGIDNDNFYFFWLPMSQEIPFYFSSMLLRGTKKLFIYNRKTLQKTKEILVDVPPEYVFSHINIQNKELIYYTYTIENGNITVRMLSFPLSK